MGYSPFSAQVERAPLKKRPNRVDGAHNGAGRQVLRPGSLVPSGAPSFDG